MELDTNVKYTLPNIFRIYEGNIFYISLHIYFFVRVSNTKYTQPQICILNTKYIRYTFTKIKYVSEIYNVLGWKYILRNLTYVRNIFSPIYFVFIKKKYFNHTNLSENIYIFFQVYSIFIFYRTNTKCQIQNISNLKYTKYRMYRIPNIQNTLNTRTYQVPNLLSTKCTKYQVY